MICIAPNVTNAVLYLSEYAKTTPFPYSQLHQSGLDVFIGIGWTRLDKEGMTENGYKWLKMDQNDNDNTRGSVEMAFSQF